MIPFKESHLKMSSAIWRPFCRYIDYLELKDYSLEFLKYGGHFVFTFIIWSQKNIHFISQVLFLNTIDPEYDAV